MITDSIYITIVSIADTLTMLIPTFSVDPAIKNSLNGLFDIIRKFNFIFPVDTLLQLIIFVIAWKSFALIFYGINWLIRKIPTIS